jgi:uncharacterized protein YdhG (YjbR/CyaY superfamily)
MSELSDYLDGLAEPERAAIAGAYARARELVPDTVDGVSYGMPALLHRSKPLLSVMAAKAHIGLYPFSSRAIDPVRDELGDYSTSSGTVRFTADHPLPPAILDRLILARVAEIER